MQIYSETFVAVQSASEHQESLSESSVAVQWASGIELGIFADRRDQRDWFSSKSYAVFSAAKSDCFGNGM